MATSRVSSISRDRLGRPSRLPLGPTHSQPIIGPRPHLTRLPAGPLGQVPFTPLCGDGGSEALSGYAFPRLQGSSGTGMCERECGPHGEGGTISTISQMGTLRPLGYFLKVTWPGRAGLMPEPAPQSCPASHLASDLTCGDACTQLPTRGGALPFTRRQGGQTGPMRGSSHM